MFYKNGWYEPLAGYDFSDYPKNVMSVATFGTKSYIVPLVTEWQVLYYRKDLLAGAGVKVPATFGELEAAAKKLNSESMAAFASRGKGAAAVTQLSSYVYNYGGQYLDKGVAVFDSKPAVDAIRFYGMLLGNYGPKGVTSMSWENIMPLFRPERSPCGRMRPCSMARSSILPRRSWAQTRSASRTSRQARRRIRRSS